MTKVSKRSLKLLIAPYALMLGLFFLLSMWQEYSFTERFSWHIILTDFSMDSFFLTLSFVFFYFLLKNIQKGKETLTAQQERYQQVLDNMMEGIQVIGSDWRYLYLNDAAVRHSRLSREELIGHTILERYPGVEQTHFFATMQKCMEKREIAHMENDFSYPDGSIGFFELFIEPVPEGLFILSMDISERKAREKEREQRMLETQKILFKISHEVRQPVASIMSLTDLLDAKIISEEELQSVSSMMKNSIISLDVRTRDLSAYITSLDMAS